MGWTKLFFTSSIGRKFLVAITGLFLVLFLLEHLTGNLLLLLPDGGDTYNIYAHFLVTFPALRPLEVILFAGFIFHIIYALYVAIRNRQARPVRYAKTNAGVSSSWVSRNMVPLGIILLVFLVIHLAGFFASARITGDVEYVTINGTRMHDMYSLVKEKFQIWWYVAIYLVGFIALGLHLWHGFQSSFRTIGLRHPKYLPVVKGLGIFFAIAFPVGFAVIPLYFYINSIL